jgi:rhodanese-related sulfurtransferase
METPRDAKRPTVEDLLETARARLVRLTPAQALAAQAAGAVLVDVRGDDQQREHGCIPGAIRIPRNVLEWRADPSCAACDPRVAQLEAVIVVVCQQGYQSSLAASTLQDLGFAHATDLDGGFEAWRAAALPIEPLRARQPRARERDFRMDQRTSRPLDLTTSHSPPYSETF